MCAGCIQRYLRFYSGRFGTIKWKDECFEIILIKLAWLLYYYYFVITVASMNILTNFLTYLIYRTCESWQSWILVLVNKINGFPPIIFYDNMPCIYILIFLMLFMHQILFVCSYIPDDSSLTPTQQGWMHLLCAWISLRQEHSKKLPVLVTSFSPFAKKTSWCPCTRMSILLGGLLFHQWYDTVFGDLFQGEEVWSCQHFPPDWPQHSGQLRAARRYHWKPEKSKHHPAVFVSFKHIHKYDTESTDNELNVQHYNGANCVVDI